MDLFRFSLIRQDNKSAQNQYIALSNSLYTKLLITKTPFLTTCSQLNHPK